MFDSFKAKRAARKSAREQVADALQREHERSEKHVAGGCCKDTDGDSKSEGFFEGDATK